MTTVEIVDEEKVFELEYEVDEEKELLPPTQSPSQSSPRRVGPLGFTQRFWFSAGVNTGSTAAIIFVNKRIFDDVALRHAQVTFAAFHFAVTAACLYTMSSPRLAIFQRKKLGLWQIMPLAVAMIFNVVLPNASLAYSSIQFYQVVRVLVTPCVALLSYVLLHDQIPLAATLTLIPLCVGVGIVTYFDTMPGAGRSSKGTEPLGVFFAFCGLFASAVYTVLIRKTQKAAACSDMQLLLNQAPTSVAMMLYIIPFSDDVTVWNAVSVSTWLLIALSGVLAVLINVSQFAIITEAGPTSSSVVGNFKTCCIFILGGFYSRKPLQDWSFLGVVLAMGGIIAYTIITQRARTA